MSPQASLLPRFALILLASILLAMAGSITAWRLATDDALDRYREDRFRFSLSNVQGALESGLRLGFSAADLPGAQDLIDRVRTRQPGILSIDVFDGEGRVLFTTDPAGLGSTVPMAWRELCLLPGAGVQRIDEDDDRIQCIGLVNSFEQVAAGVLLRFRAYAGAQVLRGGSTPDPGTLVLALGAVFLLALAAGWIVVRPLEGRLSRALAGIESGNFPGDDPLLGEGARALADLSAMTAAMERAEAEADRIDRLEAG